MSTRHTLWLLLPLLLASGPTGCRLRSSASGDMASTGDMERRADTDTLVVTSERVEQLQARMRDLRAELEKKSLLLEIAVRERDEYKYQAENYRKDLEYVEQQFIRVESRIRKTETRADAISATAEARIMLDQARSSEKIPAQSPLLRESLSKLTDAEIQLEKGNYGGAVFFAQRSLKLAEQGRREAALRDTRDRVRLTSASEVNFREGPGTDYPVLRVLDMGDVLIVVEERESWVKARTTDSLEGWVHRSLITDAE
jgi:hypothetical protein